MKTFTFPGFPILKTLLLTAGAALLTVTPSLAQTSGAKKETEVQVVPMQNQADLWSDKAGLISYRCKNLKMVARSKKDPSIEYNLSSGLFNEKDCKSSVKSLKTTGCFCDDRELKCLETQKLQPVTIVCPTNFICFKHTGDQVGVFKVNTLGDHYTRQACEKELADLERD